VERFTSLPVPAVQQLTVDMCSLLFLSAEPGQGPRQQDAGDTRVEQ
jgi:hypothetical protein